MTPDARAHSLVDCPSGALRCAGTEQTLKIQKPNKPEHLLCRFLVRLLMVHGTLSNYRLARLIKYSFYKNLVFCFMLFFAQFYTAYSGAAVSFVLLRSLSDDVLELDEASLLDGASPRQCMSAAKVRFDWTDHLARWAGSF